MKSKNLWNLFCTLPLLAVISGCFHNIVKEVEFTPRDINCDGRPWTWDDAVTFIPEIKLKEEDTPAADIRYVFEVKEGSWWVDRKLGQFDAFFHAGERTPYKQLSNNTNYVAQGAEQPSSDGFWLVCTKKCRVKGNTGKEDDGSAKVYIVQDGWMAGTGNIYKSDPHLIECTRASTGSTGSTGTGDCPDARPFCCWRYGDGRCGECINPYGDTPQYCQ